jgi:hypothetical protein
MTTRLNKTIVITSACVVVYIIFSRLAVPFYVVFALLLLSQVLLIRMLYVILKAPRTSDRTFDEYFYDDTDIRPGKDS